MYVNEGKWTIIVKTISWIKPSIITRQVKEIKLKVKVRLHKAELMN